MKKKTYRTISSAEKNLGILELIANSEDPITAYTIADALNLDYNTVMCHLSTLLYMDFIEKVLDGYTTTLKLSGFWVKKRNQLEKQKKEIDDALESLTGKL